MVLDRIRRTTIYINFSKISNINYLSIIYIKYNVFTKIKKKGEISITKLNVSFLK